MSEAERKRKLLSKYTSPAAPTKIKGRSSEQAEQNIWMRDDD